VRRLGARRGRQRERPRGFWGALTGPNPTDRAKPGTKHHVVTDAGGVPLAATVTAANRNDVTQLLPLIEAIPPVKGAAGAPLTRPPEAIADRGYDSNPHRMKLSGKGIRPTIARRGEPHGSGLGVFRWVVERTLAWLHQARRLRVRYEKTAAIHEAFVKLRCGMICWSLLHSAAFC
jgi:transposase